MPDRELAPLLGTSRFLVLIASRELGFSEVSRLSSATDLADLTDPTHPVQERANRFETVVLRRALTRSSELYDWRRSIVSGKNDRRPVTIRLLDASGSAPLIAWRLEGAWPCRWSGPSLNAMGADVAMEELELAYEDLVWLTDPDTPPGKSPRARKKTEGA